MEGSEEMKQQDPLYQEISKKTGLFQYFNKKLEVHIQDGRVFIGKLEVLVFVVFSKKEIRFRRISSILVLMNL